jgi:hypothetical protein
LHKKSEKKDDLKVANKHLKTLILIMIPSYPIMFLPPRVKTAMTKLIVLSCLVSPLILNNEALAQNQSRSDILDLDIQGVSAFVPEDRNIYTITGEVFNNNTFPFNGVQVSATLYDNNGQVVGVGSDFTSPSGIQSGIKAPFKVDIFGTEIMGGIDAVNNYTLQVTGDLQVQLFQ